LLIEYKLKKVKIDEHVISWSEMNHNGGETDSGWKITHAIFLQITRKGQTVEQLSNQIIIFFLYPHKHHHQTKNFNDMADIIVVKPNG